MKRRQGVGFRNIHVLWLIILFLFLGHVALGEEVTKLTNAG